jgi:hypothetical protein
LDELVLPLPALPALSATPVLSSVMTLVASSTEADGVYVPVQVVPPSLELSEETAPLATVRSAVVKPVTASLKVMVTVAVSPAASAESDSAMVAVGRVESMV